MYKIKHTIKTYNTIRIDTEDNIPNNYLDNERKKNCSQFYNKIS